MLEFYKNPRTAKTDKTKWILQKKTLLAADITHTDKTVLIQKTSFRWESGTEERAEQLALMRGKYLRYNEADAGTKKSKSMKTVARCISCDPIGPLRVY